MNFDEFMSCEQLQSFDGNKNHQGNKQVEMFGKL